MKQTAWCLPLACLLFTACERADDEVVVTETRAITTRDVSPKLFATSDERFRNARPSPLVAGQVPDAWLALPSTEMRPLNYRFGESGLGEVYVSLSGGGLLENVNRWLLQFRAPTLDAPGLAAARRVEIAGTEGVWVEATGEYNSGMGAPSRPGFGLAGVVAESGGRILTIKMVGPAPEVESAKSDLESFANALRMTE